LIPDEAAGGGEGVEQLAPQGKKKRKKKELRIVKISC